MFIVHDKETDRLTPYSSLTSISRHEGISIYTLRWNFTKMKRKEYSKKGIRIVKAKLIKRTE